MKFLKRYVSQIVIIAFALIFTVVLYLYFNEFYEIFNDPIKFKNQILSHGSVSFIFFIMAQIIQVVVFMIPGEFVQVAGGYIYGTFFGTIISSLGIALGSTIVFLICRNFERKFIMDIISKKDHKFLSKLLSLGSQKKVIFIAHAIPGIPKDVFAYICGVSNVGYKDYIIYSTLGRIPGITLSALFGSELSSKDYSSIIVISFVSVLILLICLLKKEDFFNKIMKKKP